MKHISLFSGIGGFDLAAEWMGWENVAHCEWNPFGQKVLKYYWPNAISYHDITKTDFTIHRGNIDIVTGGFPCQPFSSAGKRKGKDDDRYLWPEMLRAIREIEPRYIVGENVYGIINWDGGLVFEEVQTDLENAGYEIQTFVLPAASVNAPHKRDRVWFVAYSGSKRCNNGSDNRKERQVYNNKNRNAQEDKPNGTDGSVGLARLGKLGMLPTPNASEGEKYCINYNPKSQMGTALTPLMNQITGKSSQLKPRFVMEMMGFPPDWTELPFLNGETNQSKQEGTQ